MWCSGVCVVQGGMCSKGMTCMVKWGLSGKGGGHAWQKWGCRKGRGACVSRGNVRAIETATEAGGMHPNGM